jgi:hypothetical protein
MDRANIIRCWSATEGARDALRPNRRSMACSGPIRQSAATIKLTTTRTYIVPTANQARAYISERNCDFIDTRQIWADELAKLALHVTTKIREDRWMRSPQ